MKDPELLAEAEKPLGTQFSKRAELQALAAEVIGQPPGGHRKDESSARS
jgi:hypothetical protein